MKLLLTGASGSFGTALLAHVFRHGLAEKVIAYARGEHRLAELAERLGHPPELRLMVGDVRDPERVHEAMGRIDTVIHAAAMKRVDVISHDPLEIMKTNFLGTVNVVRAAVQRNVPRVLLISSDKACAPSTRYGLSKAAAEEYAVHANAQGHPQVRISAVRYGNVAGSQGSVIPFWRRLLAAGQPIPLTDARMTRFWLTMPEAIDFVLGALRDMRGGEVFIPRLRAARMVALAEAMGATSGQRRIIGPRGGGEKLHETLLSEDESGRAVWSAERFILEPAFRPWPYDSWAGQRLAPGFRWRSDEAPQMAVEELRMLVRQSMDGA